MIYWEIVIIRPENEDKEKLALHKQDGMRIMKGWDFNSDPSQITEERIQDIEKNFAEDLLRYENYEPLGDLDVPIATTIYRLDKKDEKYVYCVIIRTVYMYSWDYNKYKNPYQTWGEEVKILKKDCGSWLKTVLIDIH